MDLAIFADVEPEVDTFVDGKARDQAMLMVDMGAQRAHTVRGVDVVLHKCWLQVAGFRFQEPDC